MRQHRDPPPEFSDAKFIVDLGCNRGEAAQVYLERYPEAFVLGVEIDAGLAAQAVELNPDRFEVMTLAVGYPHRKASIRWDRDESHLVEGDEMEVWTLDEILEKAGRSDEVIDFVKMDVEGEEGRILAGGGEWVKRTRAMIVESHIDPVSEIEKAAEALGFEVSKLLPDPLWNNHLWCVSLLHSAHGNLDT